VDLPTLISKCRGSSSDAVVHPALWRALVSDPKVLIPIGMKPTTRPTQKPGQPNQRARIIGEGLQTEARFVAS
jgi:hypothetical protein